MIGTPAGNKLGLTALMLSVVGFVLACLPSSLSVGWVVLLVAFVLGVAGALRSRGNRRASVAAIGVSAFGAVVSAGIVLFGVAGFFVDLFAKLIDYIFVTSGRP